MMKTYTTTEFAKKAHVSVRTVRYYDSIGLLKPSYYDDNGRREYTNNDFLELQKILSLKFLGFSLKEIEQLTHDMPSKEISSYFDLQIKLVQKKINNLKQVEKGLIDASKIIEAQGTLKWEDVIHLIYLMDMEEQLMARVLKEEGIFYCTTYGKNHMWEISELVKEFDNRIELSEIELYKIFGIENGFEILENYFEEVELKMYEDELLVDDAEILGDYIFSCHGNQNEILHGRKMEFKEFLWCKMKNHKFKITKEAGVFICKHPRKNSNC